MTNPYFYQTFVVTMLIVEVVAAGLYFTSVWVRSGYEGKDKQLDLLETGAYYKHVIGFLFVLVSTGVIFLPPIMGTHFPTEVWWFLGAMFTAILGAEVFTDVRSIRIKPKEKKEVIEPLQ